MQSTHRNTKLLQHRCTRRIGICPGQGDDEGKSAGWVRKAQNGMLSGLGKLHPPYASSLPIGRAGLQSPVARDPAR